MSSSLIILVSLYIVVAVMVGLFLNMLIISSIDEDDYDEVLLDDNVRFFAILILSIFWFITVPIIVYNNIKNN